MENIQQILPGLIAVTQAKRQSAALFTYQFNGLRVRGIFFAKSITMLIGIVDKNVAWQCDLSKGVLSEQIPHEAYQAIGEALVSGEGEEKRRSNKPFFLRLRNELENLVESNDSSEPSDNDIKDLLGKCKTNDTKYDREGKRPFFKCFRRVRPSPESREKIQRNFGRAVREACYQNRVTAVWSEEPTNQSLLFIDPDEAIRNIRALFGD